jgi:hypothetical protein
MRFSGGEENMYFVFSLSHLSPAFCVLGFGCLLSTVMFLAEIFVKWIAKDRTVKWSEDRKGRHCEPTTAPLLARLNIQNRISATEKCANLEERNIFILSAKNNLQLKQDDGKKNILTI